MNKNYTYIDGKVIISDESGKQTPIEYFDNLDDILIKENLIETMENRIGKLEEESMLYKKYNKKHYIPIILIGIVLMSTVGINLLSYHITGINPFLSSINTVFGVVNEGVMNTLLASCSCFPGIIVEAFLYGQFKYEKIREKGIDSELDFLKKQIVKEKQALEDLKKEKRRDNENKEFRVVEVNDKEQLQALKENLNLYFNLGCNAEKYYKYLQQGKLDNKLKKHYNDSEIKNAKEYLEEKGPILARSKNN